MLLLLTLRDSNLVHAGKHRMEIQMNTQQHGTTHPNTGPTLTLLCPKEAACLLKCSEWTLAEWRCTGEGPYFSRLGRLIRYQLSDIADWVEQNSVISTSMPRPKTQPRRVYKAPPAKASTRKALQGRKTKGGAR